MRLQQLCTPSVSLPEAVKSFMLHQQASRHSPMTIRRYEYTLRQFETFLGPQTLLDQITPSLLREFMLKLEGRVKANTVLAHMRDVKAFLRFCEREDLLEKNPIYKVTMPKVDSQILPALTEEEVDCLINSCSTKTALGTRNRAILLLMLDTGLRLSEVADIKVGDIDQNGLIIVMGKGRKERMVRLGGTALKAVQKYSRLRGGQTGEVFWLGVRGPMTARGIAEMLEKLSKPLGISCHPHKLRRTCALMMLRNGCDIFSLQHMLGHADITVLRRYLAQTQADIIRAHQIHSRMDNLGNKRSTG